MIGACEDADEIIDSDLDGQRLLDLYKSSPTKRTYIRNSAVLTKRVVSHALDIHPSQMNDDFASTALNNIYRAHENYTSAIGFSHLAAGSDPMFRHLVTDTDRCKSYLFIENTPLLLFSNPPHDNGLRVLDLKADAC